MLASIFSDKLLLDSSHWNSVYLFLHKLVYFIEVIKKKLISYLLYFELLQQISYWQKQLF